jgi:hypothetical protein
MKSFFFRNDELPKKAVVLSVFFTIVGLVLIGLSFTDEVRRIDPFGGYLMLGSGIVIFIPGVY